MTEAIGTIEIVNGQLARRGKHEWAIRPYSVDYTIALLNSLPFTEWCHIDRLVRLFNGGRVSERDRAAWRKRLTKIKRDALKRAVLLNVQRNESGSITQVKVFRGDPEERQRMLDEIEGMRSRKEAANQTLDMAVQLALALELPQ